MPQLSDKELEDRLAAAGKSLAQPPSSLDELLHLLDRAEELLSKVEQSPSKTMQTALSPLMKALVTEVLLKHSDIDVKAGVASCISEITRITAPDAPYDDDQMKDLFQLIVSSFENLSDVSSRSHEKRKTILETVAKVRSCVIMLDLECDQMIIDMFKHFLKSIRDYHDEMIFASMETIITLVLEESEDISSDLLAPILSTLKRKNQDVTPVARKLAERVIQNSTDKLRPYLSQVVTSLGTSLDDYSEVVASVCRENTDTVGHGNDSTLKDLPVLEGKCTSASPARDPGTPVLEGKCTIASPARDPGTPVAEEDGEGTDFQDTDSTAIRSPKSVVSNGIDETETNEIPTEANTSKKVDSDSHFDATLKMESDDCDEQKSEKLEADDEQAQQEAENHDTAGKDMHISPTEVKPVETAESLNKGEDRSVEVVIEAAKPVDILTEASPAQSGSHPDETLSETEIKEAREENFVDEETVSVDTDPKKEPEEETISELKKQRRSGKKQIDDKDKASEEVASKDYDGYASDSEARSLDRVEKSRDARNKVALRKENVKKSGHGKPTVEKDTPKSSAREDHGKDIGTPRKSQSKSTKLEKVQEETPRMSNKRKHASGKEKASSEILEYGKNLVGLKVKVWWPQDRKFYEGVVESFDSGKKKHKVLYNDGDEEILNLKKERWQRLEDDVISNGDQDVDVEVENSSHDTSSDIRVKRKGNTSSETTSKRQKVEGSPKSKQKDTATKSSGKSKDDGKAESGSKENYQKLSKKTVDDRSKDQSQKVGGKGQVDSVKASGRSKEDVAKSAGHSKQDNIRTPKSKGKTPPGAKLVGSGGSRTTKTSTSKVKETDKMKEKTPDAAKSSETTKGKAADSAKSRESEAKGGKKRRR